MKKAILFFIYLVLCFTMVFWLSGNSYAQNYTIHQSTGDEYGDWWSSGYVYNFDNTASVDNGSMSGRYDLPFPWYFYGNLVTEYYISENGYISFGSGGSSIGANTSLPNPSAPLNSIFAFWDDYSWNSYLSIKTFGGAPNRVHVITWYNAEYSSNSAQKTSIELRLFESCADFEVDIASNSVSGSSGTVGCQNANGTVGAQLAGSPSVVLPALSSSFDTDNIVYVFQYDGAVEQDLALIGLDIPSHLTPGSHVISGHVRNRGNQTISSYNINYSLNGGMAVSQAVSSNLGDTDGSGMFTINTPITVSGPGENMTLKVWVSDPNGMADQRACNDTITRYLTSNSSLSSPKKALVEEFTGTWCAYCIDGAVRMEEMEHDYPNSFIPVAIHDGDPMEFNEEVRTAFSVNSFPSALINRKDFSPGNYEAEPVGRSIWKILVGDEVTKMAPAELNIQHTFDDQTRMVDVTVDVNYSDYSAGNNRIVLMVVEDSLTGTGGQWAQANAYDGVAGHPYFGAGSPVAGFVHRHVLREQIDSGPFGTPGVVPPFVAPNTTVSQQFQFTLSNNYDPDQIYLVAALVRYVEGNDPFYYGVRGNREILNSTRVHLQDITIGREETALVDFEVYPNPATDYLQVKLGEELIGKKIKISLLNLNGQVCYSGELQTSSSNRIQVSHFSRGVYFLGVNIDGQEYYSKVLLN